MICNFFYKEIIGIGILFFFQFYCAFSTTTVYQYTLLLFWNVFWTLVPVCFMGVFDRNLPYNVIMQVPEVYRFGIENRWFGLRRFCIYMFDGIYAVRWQLWSELKDHMLKPTISSPLSVSLSFSTHMTRQPPAKMVTTFTFSSSRLSWPLQPFS